ncbi:MAG: hypothetical protein NTZ90_09425 [Proteobacteria bacterium]|nr:hypothetical protein [Pseudomonadota bacterium]
MTDAAVLPNIFDYMDYRLFLKDQPEYLQSRDRKFSQRWVAKRAGFKAPRCCPKRLMPELKELTQRIIREVDTLVEAQQDRDEVCHLHIELLPLTRWQDSPAD